MSHKNKDGIGNSSEGEETETIIAYVLNNKDLFVELIENDYNYFDYFQDIASDLMGNSECYDFRVCESVVCTYSDKDVFSNILIL